MLTALLALTLLVSGQVTELPGDSETIQVITLQNGDVRYGAVRENGSQITIVWDTPWAPQPPKSISPFGVSYEPEVRAKRDSRRVEEAHKAGYVLYETAGGPLWIKQEDVTFAERAQRMAERLEAKQHAAGAPGAAVSVTAETPGFVKQWGAHVAIVLVGFGLIAFAVKTALRS